MNKTVYLTQKGFVKAQSELHFLKTEKRNELAKRLKDIRLFDDNEPDFELFSAKEEQSFLEGKIRDLEFLLANAVLINPDSSGKVILGSTVLVQQEGYDKETFTIVGPAETNPKEKFISDESPLGRSLLGCQPGEEVEVTTPRGPIKFKILGIV